MKKTGHARIDDLTAVGHQIAEEDLSLAAGGRVIIIICSRYSTDTGTSCQIDYD